MSRKGKNPIPVPKGVAVEIKGNEIHVNGPKGALNLKLLPAIEVEIQTEQLNVKLAETHQNDGAIHGLYRSLIDNMVVGVSQGFEKKLEMIGVGYRASVQGEILDLQVGFSFVEKNGQRVSQKRSQVAIPKGIQIKVEKNTLITINGIDKQQVGQIAAEIRAIRPPEPYKGKGIRYPNEHVRKKAGKAAAKK
ncbi:MAG: 50S ribosomal protein L6 [Parachlamydiaceae bacterium]|nr:50S ribosomal protein L6 [Parachlamydiaceae bacterium]